MTMFSECMALPFMMATILTHCLSHLDASRFLAQSQSRIMARPDDTQRGGRGRSHGNSRFPSSLLNRIPGDPYQPDTSQVSNFPFASRASAQPAPLFYSATDEFREEDDETEHEREIADFYALQKSRRHFGGSNMKDSSEFDEDDEESSASLDQQQSLYADKSMKGKGIRSSWRGGKVSSYSPRNVLIEPLQETTEIEQQSPGSRGSSRVRENLVDVGLGDTLRTDEGARRSASPEFGDDNPPSIQRFREQPDARRESLGLGHVLTDEPNKELLSSDSRPMDSGDPGPMLTAAPSVESPAHDAFWGQLFLITLACLFATALLVYLHTSSPSGDKSKWGDTVYMTVHKSFHLLGIYTLVSVFVSLFWLVLLRSYVRLLIYGMIVAVPVVLYSFSIYPFVSSFKGSWHGASIQDKVLRFGSAVPFVMASAWIYNVIRGRNAIGKAANILEFACRILAANPELLALGLGVLLCVVSWTWVWMLMFTRVFLGGHISGTRLFIIDIGTWWLGVYFILVYIWSLGILAGIQRTVTSATVSQWYFHRFATPAPTSRQIVQAAMVHSFTVLFGTICLSRFLALLIRLPLLMLPRRITSLLTLFAYSFVPTPIPSLTDPLALTYAAIHSKSLAVSSRGLNQMTSLSPSSATSSLHPRSFSSEHGTPISLLPYRLSKLILHATRFMMSLGLSFGGWVTTARNLNTPSIDGTTGGSMYAYVVGLIAGSIGWSVLGAIEGVIADIVDALVICWSSEVGSYSREARYCREAGWLFGEHPHGHRYLDV